MAAPESVSRTRHSEARVPVARRLESLLCVLCGLRFSAVNLEAVKEYYLELQARIVARLEAARRAGVPPRRLGAARRRRRLELPDRGRASVRARRGELLARHRHPPAAVGQRCAAGARGPRLPGHGRVAGAASAQPLRAHRAHERALLRGRAGRRRAGVVVRRRHGSHALLRLRRGCGAFSSHLPGGAGAVRRRRIIRASSSGATSTST